ncbi:choloylglycine hydrolase [Chlorella sorokiniana]|uniref:Choloylglycine hydrolase n=1 Tax=Chlorella sorokiniana TaxID=3076 RepID=A0A2P6TSW0_CHLSO|nr:choloylglycine hydrolase [Chlorella sorokiniana]|eukprot:PRW57133.1 choloylglycine hydrolase [Chlorella sorokiniana]
MGAPCALLAASLLLLSCAARACSDIMLSNPDIFEDAVVSARNYDFFDQTADNVGIARVATGTPLARLPVNGCELSPFNGQKAKFGFVCMNILNPQVADEVTKLCPNANMQAGVNYPGVCQDGMNTAGLSVGSLTEQSAGNFPTALNGTAPALNWYDITNFLLSEYATVEEIKKDFEPGKLQLVANNAFLAGIGAAGEIIATRKLHWALHDSTGASAVIEIPADGSRPWIVRDNRLGVLTNTPQLPAHEAAYASWRAGRLAVLPPAEAAVSFVGFCGSLISDALTNVTNDNCNSLSRFTILAQLKESLYDGQANGTMAGGIPNTWYNLNPGYNTTATHQAMMQTILFLNWVTIPGTWPVSNFTGAEEMTILYVRTAAQPNWARYDVEALAEVPGLKNVPLATIQGTQVPFAKEETEALM